jgi:predicted TIM-barrel fold metal-dependent hydrolase
MFKKPLILATIIGALLIIAGLILSPSFVGNFTSSGKIVSVLRITQLQLIQIYLILFGLIVFICALVFNFLPEVKIISQLLLFWGLTGIALTISGIILTPKFVEKNLSAQNFLNEGVLNYLSNLQITIITLGCAIFLISLLIFQRRLLIRQKWLIPTLILMVFVVYAAIMYKVYFEENYPNNIILKPAEFSKVLDLILGREIVLSDFDPKPNLIVERKQILKSKYPAIDIHFHLASDFRTEKDKIVLAPDALIRSMDSVGVKLLVNMDGIDIDNNLILYTKKYPNRFINFAYPPLNSSELTSDETLAALPDLLEDFVRRGIRGVGELAKYIGLTIKDTSGKVIPIDDPRLDPFWAKAGELNIPFLWHVADPTSFFQPVNRFNERFTELGRYPFWSYYRPGIPDKATLYKQLENVLKKHPNTIVIGAHMGQLSDNLKYLSYLFDTYPNYYVDCSAAFSELGRQPYTARKFFIKYQDRILFGTDGGCMHDVRGWTIEKFFQSNFEFLETENEYIEYPMQGAINQGNWRIYGINLPDEVLEKVYYKNAEKILFKNKETNVFN